MARSPPLAFNLSIPPIIGRQGLPGYIQDMPESPANDSPAELGDQADDAEQLAIIRRQLAIIHRQLDHVDEMLHEVTRFIADNKPALDQAMALLDPGKPMRVFLGGRRGKNAVPQDHQPR
jgi:hypothetical protein